MKKIALINPEKADEFLQGIGYDLSQVKYSEQENKKISKKGRYPNVNLSLYEPDDLLGLRAIKMGSIFFQ